MKLTTPTTDSLMIQRAVYPRKITGEDVGRFETYIGQWVVPYKNLVVSSEARFIYIR